MRKYHHLPFPCAEAMKSMRAWLMHNQRMINVVVMGIFGILLLFLGLTSII
jgi:hypothetical protein